MSITVRKICGVPLSVKISKIDDVVQRRRLIDALPRSRSCSGIVMMSSKATALHKFAPAAELGPADDYQPGSVEWAIRISNRLQIAASSLSSHSVLHLRNTVKAIWEAQPPPWEIFPEGKPYGTPDDYCIAVTGHSWEFLVGMIKEFSGDDDLSTEKMRATLARAQVEHRSPGRRTIYFLTM